MDGTINFGIDLGTTNSSIAVYQNGEVEVFKNPSNLKQTLPSVVAFKGERVIVGDKAKEILQKAPQNVFGTFKRKMGTSDKYFVETLSEFMSPTDLSAIVLRELKNFIHTDENPSSIVITIPAAFDTMQSNATKKAGYAAGFHEVVLLQEPIAASLAFANKTKAELDQGQWLVYDFGGGTFDVALASIEDEEMRIIDHEGDNYLGGTDFDRAIIDEFVIPLMKSKGEFYNLESDLKKASGKYNRLYNKLLYIVEEAKIELSNKPISEIEFDFTDDTGAELEFFEELSRSTFETIIKPQVDQTVDMIHTVIQRNSLSASDIQCILLIGGTTYIPLVKQSLSDAFGVPVNSSMDPTTAVVVGAAYYAGIKPKKVPKTVQATAQESTLKIKLAYDRVVQSDQGLLMFKSEEPEHTYFYRILRRDGGYDSGLLPLNSNNKCFLPIVANVHNVFDLVVNNKQGDRIHSEQIGISHGNFGIDGQPLPDNICLEVDAIEEKTTFLEPIFRKNSILPLKKTIVKQVSKTIHKSSDDKLIIKVVEGVLDTIPSANKVIGIIEISGNLLERDLIKGSDIELSFEITESRDIKVSAYLTMTDQEFADTFSPSEFHVSQTNLLKETKFFKSNLLAKQKEYEVEGKYEKAAAVSHLLQDIIDLEVDINALMDDDVSDTKYKIELRKRNLGRKIHNFYNSSYLTKTIENYYEEKNKTKNMLLHKDANEGDKLEFDKLVEDEKTFLNEGNITTIKMKVDHLKSIAQKIYNRDQQPISPGQVSMYFNMLKYKEYKEKEKANQFIKQGELELSRENYVGLYNACIQLQQLINKEKSTNTDLFRNDGTGLK